MNTHTQLNTRQNLCGNVANYVRARAKKILINWRSELQYRVISKRQRPDRVTYNGLHKTSKGMREMNYQDTQHFERATMLKLPIQPLLVLCGVMHCLLFVKF